MPELQMNEFLALLSSDEVISIAIAPAHCYRRVLNCLVGGAARL